MLSEDLRHSPLDAEHKALGAKLVDFGGWSMPVSYPSGTIAEHLACRSDAVAFDVSHLGTVRMQDADAYERLQRALTNDLERIGPGRAQYTHLLDDSGSVLDDIIIWWVDDKRFDVMPNASNTSRVLDAIGGIDVTADRAVIAVQGPNARAKVARFSTEAAEVGRFKVVHVEFNGADCVVAGTGYTGEDGLEFAIPVEVARDLWAKLQEVDVVPAGLGARDTLRLEAGLPLHGHELGAGITPLQAGLGWVVSWDKGDFIGRDALVAEREAKPARRLRGFSAEGRQPLREGSAVIVDGQEVGALTSGNFSPSLGHAIGMGFVPPDVKVGATVEIELRGRRLPAVVVQPPFVTKAV